MTTLTCRDDIHVLDLGDDENRFTPNWLDTVEAALDRVVSSPAPLITVASGRFYSNGLDLDWITANPDELQPYVARVQRLLARVMALPVPTVAALNGHAFGAGAMLAMAHDWRIMRHDRGYFCFPEVDIAIPFTPGMAGLVQAKVGPRAAVDAMTTGHRFTAPEAVEAGLVDGSATAAALLDRAQATVAHLAGKDPATLGAIKSTMYATVLGLLDATTT